MNRAGIAVRVGVSKCEKCHLFTSTRLLVRLRVGARYIFVVIGAGRIENSLEAVVGEGEEAGKRKVVVAVEGWSAADMYRRSCRGHVMS